MTCTSLYLRRFLLLPSATLHSFRRFHSMDNHPSTPPLSLSLTCGRLASSSSLTRNFSIGALLIVDNTAVSTLLDKHALVITTFYKHSIKSNASFASSLHAFRSTVHHAENLYERTHSALSLSSFKSS